MDNLKIREKIYEQQVQFQTVTANGENKCNSQTLQTEHEVRHFSELVPSGCTWRWKAYQTPV
jgi:hypothetical protein